MISLARRSLFVVFLGLLFQTLSFARDASYSLVQIKIANQQDWKRLQTIGLALEEGLKFSEGSIEMVLSDQEIRRVEQQHFQISIVQPDFSSHLRSGLSAAGEDSFATGSMGGYFTFSEVLTKLQEYHKKYPNIVGSLKQIGTSIEGRPIIAVKISDNPDTEEPDEPEVLYMALHHAREPASMMTVLYFMEQLTGGYQKKLREITYLVDHRQMWFVPVVNPDGYVYNEITNPSGGALWRKNRRNNGNGTFGVDLNRNYALTWGHDNEGSSPDPGSDAYRGTGPFSEPETAAIRDFVAQHRFALSMSYHSYFGAVLYPWAYKNATPDRDLFRMQSEQLTYLDDYARGNVYSVLHYFGNGGSEDWLYGALQLKPRIIAYTCEVGSSIDNFWPSRPRLLHIVRENYQPNLMLARMAEGFVTLKYKQNSLANFAPGQTGNLIVDLENAGLKTSNRLSTILKSNSPWISVQTSTADVGDLRSRESLRKSLGRISVSPTAKIGTIVPLDLYIYSNGRLLRKERVGIYVD